MTSPLFHKLGGGGYHRLWRGVRFVIGACASVSASHLYICIHTIIHNITRTHVHAHPGTPAFNHADISAPHPAIESVLLVRNKCAAPHASRFFQWSAPPCRCIFKGCNNAHTQSSEFMTGSQGNKSGVPSVLRSNTQILLVFGCVFSAAIRNLRIFMEFCTFRAACVARTRRDSHHMLHVCVGCSTPVT